MQNINYDDDGAEHDLINDIRNYIISGTFKLSRLKAEILWRTSQDSIEVITNLEYRNFQQVVSKHGSETKSIIRRAKTIWKSLE